PRERIDSTYGGTNSGRHLLRLSTPAENIGSIIIIEIHSKYSGMSYLYDFSISGYPLTLLDESNYPVLNQWVAPGKYHFNQKKPLTGFFYNNIFPPALPPMP